MPVAITLAHWVSQLVHPWNGIGYNIWSGLGSDLGEIAIVGGVIAWYRKHNCHVHRCPRLSWHPREDGHPVCRRHHPDHPTGGGGKVTP